VGWGRGLILPAAAFAAATSALADDGLRKLCTDRPGLGTPACIVDAGHVQVEIGLADWTLDRQGPARSDQWLAGDLLVRIGVDPRMEVQVGWTAYGHVRDRARGAVDRASGGGDLLIAVRRSLRHPDGAGTTVAVMPYLRLPTGGAAIGAGAWSAGLGLPFGFDLSDSVSLEFAPRAEAAADSDRDGRHFGPKLNMTAELAATRDDDPGGHRTERLAGLSFGWTPTRNFQLDAGANVGLDHEAADLELYAGISRRF
jgi:hypothetical protein